MNANIIIVCCPEDRPRIFKDEIERYTKSQVYILCRQKDSVEVLAVNIQEDHIHLVISRLNILFVDNRVSEKKIGIKAISTIRPT